MATERDKQRERTRQRLYEAALEVFRQDGVEAARVDDIAKTAGVSRATFYFHFPTKDDVLVARLAQSQARIHAEISALPPEADIETVLRLAARHIAHEWEDDPGLLREVGTVALKVTAQDLPAATRRHPVQLALIPRFDSSVQLARTAVREAVERAEIDTLIPAELLTEFFLVNLFGAALTWCSAPLAPLDEILDQVVTFFLRGARPDEA